MGQAYGPVQVVFDQHMRGAEVIPHLIEPSFMDNREILSQTPTGLATQGRIHCAVRRRRAMQIDRLSRGHGKWACQVFCVTDCG